jgi:hypothetical protein
MLQSSIGMKQGADPTDLTDAQWTVLAPLIPPAEPGGRFPMICRPVHAASIQDRLGAKLVLEQLVGKFPRLQRIWADGG